MIGAGYRLAVLAFEEDKREEAQERLERGIDDCIEESWDRLEGFHRRYLGELEMRADAPDLFKARDQLERARDLITETDTRMRALIEQSLATLEERIGNPAKALDNAKAARDHFEKLRMKKELEEATSSGTAAFSSGWTPMRAGN